jgi:hypothetical protein
MATARKTKSKFDLDKMVTEAQAIVTDFIESATAKHKAEIKKDFAKARKQLKSQS